jgi:hypothetical protein
MKTREYGVIETYNGSFCFIRAASGERDIFALKTKKPPNEGADSSVG